MAPDFQRSDQLPSRAMRCASARLASLAWRSRVISAAMAMARVREFASARAIPNRSTLINAPPTSIAQGSKR